MKAFMSCLLAIVMLCGCGIEEGIKHNEDRYLKPGALDLPLTNYYDTYQYKFLGKYRITHQWPVSAGSCKYRSLPTLGRNNDRYKGEIYAVPDIYEENGKTYQASNTGRSPMDFDRYVCSVKVMNPVYGTPTKEELQASEKAQRERIERARRTGRYESDTPDIVKPIGYKEIETGLQAVCQQSWYATQHGLTVWLRKWSVDQYLTWLKKNSQQQGRVTHQRIGTNNWTVLEFNLEPQSTDGASSGPYQFWMLPIGDTGYTFLFRLGANLESLKYPDAHERFKATFRHLIESVNIEPLQP